jgi:hypothetical protein
VLTRPKTSQPLAGIAWLITYHYAPVTAIFWSEVSSWRKAPQVVHCNNLDTLLVGILAKRAFGSRVIYDAHEYEEKWSRKLGLALE